MSSPHRTLVVANLWPRDPKGKPLPNPPPRGTRPPNGIMWAHSLNDYFWIQRIPNINVMTIWSRSMIREFGENFLAQEHEDEPEPELIKPWPILKILLDDSQNSELSESTTKDDGTLATTSLLTSDNCELSGSALAEDTTQTRHDDVVPLEENAVDTLQGSSNPTIEIVDMKVDLIDGGTLSSLPLVNVTGSNGDFQVDNAPLSKDNDIPTAATSAATSENTAPEHGASVSSISKESNQDSTSESGCRGDHNNNDTIIATETFETPISFHGSLLNDTDFSCLSGHQSDPTATNPIEAETSSTNLGPSSGSNPRSRTSLDFDNAVSLDLPTSAVDSGDRLPDLGTPESWVCVQDGATGTETSGGYETHKNPVPSETPPKNFNKCSLGGDEKEERSPPEADVDTSSQTVNRKKSVTCLENVTTNHTGGPDDGDMAIITAKPDVVPPITVDNDPVVQEMPKEQKTTILEDGNTNKSVTHENVDIEKLETINQGETGSGLSENMTTSDKPSEDASYQGSGGKDSPEESDEEQEDVKIDLPKLEEFIPDEYFPDILIVHDPLDRTRPLIRHSYAGVEVYGENEGEPTLKRYKRVWPKFPRDKEPGTLFNTNPRCASIAFDSQKTITPDAQLNIGRLDLAGEDILGTGNHSVVFRAPLQFPHPLSADSPTNQVTVAAKTAISKSEARQLLNNEAHIYSKFPKHLMEHYTGFHLVKPCTHPVPVNAIVPKFFGFYVPVREEREAERRAQKKAERIAQQKVRREAKERLEANREKAVDPVAAEPYATSGEESESEETCSDDEDSNDDDEYDDDDPFIRRDALSPILLLEECGVPVVPRDFTPDERSACYSSMLRLHHACFSQNSFYVRNILRQPGPINLPPHMRSDKTPIFRIIDFGRGEHLWTMIRKKLQKQKLMQVQSQIITVLNQECFSKRERERDRREYVTREVVKEWVDKKDYDVRKAQDELEIFNFDF